MLECPFCKDPNLFRIDFLNCPIEYLGIGVSARGHFWKRIKNDRYPAWPVPLAHRTSGPLHSKMLIGKENFSPKWQQFDIEILGFDFTERPEMPPLPFFGISTTKGLGGVSYILWNACRIVHEEFGFRVNLHWWPDHGRIFTVENFDFGETATRSSLNRALAFFSPGPGRKPSEYFTSNKEFFEALKVAVMRHYDAGFSSSEILESKIAEDLFPEAIDSARTLRRSLQTSWRKWKWQDVVKSIIDSVTEERHRHNT